MGVYSRGTRKGGGNLRGGPRILTLGLSCVSWRSRPIAPIYLGYLPLQPRSGDTSPHPTPNTPPLLLSCKRERVLLHLSQEMWSSGMSLGRSFYLFYLVFLSDGSIWPLTALSWLQLWPHFLDQSKAAMLAGFLSHGAPGISQSCLVHKEPLGAAFHRRGQLEFYGLSSTSVNVW